MSGGASKREGFGERVLARRADRGFVDVTWPWFGRGVNWIWRLAVGPVSFVHYRVGFLRFLFFLDVLVF